MNDRAMIQQLHAISRRFGRAAAAEKQALLEKIDQLPRLSLKQLRLLHDTLNFIRAYPDGPAVLDRARRTIASLRVRVERRVRANPDLLCNSGICGSTNVYAYSYAVLQRLTQLHPGCVEIDWDGVGDLAPLFDTLALTLTAGELQGLDDLSVDSLQWLASVKTRDDRSDLETVLELFGRSPLTPQQQSHLFEACELPCRYRLAPVGSGRAEGGFDPARICYQRREISRTRFPLAGRIKRPLDEFGRLSPREGQRLIDVATVALCSRNLEIFPLIYANPADVTLVRCGRGLAVMLAGVLPPHRDPLEALFFFAIFKNGVPIAYGPASSFVGCCEMGINLFPEFRGGEIRYIYAEFMRAMHHLAGVDYFFLTPYGMGENNDEALASGAFWFYRRLGFRPSNPQVEALARAEEQVMRRQPGYRCSRATLRRLSHTSAYLDLSRGACRPLRFGAVGMALSRMIARDFANDRARATRSCVRRLLRTLQVDDYRDWDAAQRQAMERLAPICCLIPGLERWSRRDRRALARLVRAKGGPSEYDYIARVRAHQRLVDALRALQ